MVKLHRCKRPTAGRKRGVTSTENKNHDQPRCNQNPSWQLESPHRSAQKQLRDVLRKIPSRYRKAACRQAQAELVLEEYRNAQEQTPVCEYLYGRWRSPEEGDIHVRG